ncbi:MAG TPA: RNA methyltransferase [Herpetosiphonaceae bacterium]
MITSTKNPQIKHLRSLLTNRKDRRSERLFVIEGVRLVEEALQAQAEIAIVVYNRDQLATTERGTALIEQLSHSQAYEVSPEVLQAVSDTVTPQGVVAAVRWPELESPMYGVVLVLDALQDPGNVGTLLRSAVATGIGQVICTAGTADVYSPKVARAAMGAHFRLPIAQDVSWDDAPLMLSTTDNVYAAVAEASMPYYAADWRQPSALIVGNEANGVSAAGLEIATKQIAIPMAPGVESLNAAVAGSVILFEMQRQRRLGRS